MKYTFDKEAVAAKNAADSAALAKEMERAKEIRTGQRTGNDSGIGKSFYKNHDNRISLR